MKKYYWLWVHWIEQNCPSGKINNIIIFNIFSYTFSDEPMTRFPKGINSLFPVNTRFKDVSDAIEKDHSGIAHMFYTGIGHCLQFLEGQITNGGTIKANGEWYNSTTYK